MDQVDAYHGAQCWVAGWGHQFWNGQQSDTPKSVGVNLLSRDYCVQHSLYADLGDLFSLTDDTFCAGIPHNDKTKKNSQGYTVTRSGADSCKGTVSKAAWFLDITYCPYHMGQGQLQ